MTIPTSLAALRKRALPAVVALLLGSSALLLGAVPAQAAAAPQITVVAGAPEGPFAYAEYNGLTYLAGIKTGDIYPSLFSFNGTTFTPIAGSPLGVNELVVVDGKLLIKAMNPGFTDFVFYSYDGTSVVPLVHSFVSPQDFVLVGGILYFAAEYGSGLELTTYDGTSFGVITGYTPDVFSISVFGGAIYFQANDGVDERLFIVSPGSSVAAAVPTSPLDPGELTVYNGLAYLGASDGSTYHLYSFDGVTFAIVPTPASTGAGALTVFNGKLYFVADDGVDFRLYSYNSVGGAVVAVPDGSTETNDVFVFDGKLMFPGPDSPTTYTLKSFDGTTTSIVAGAAAEGPYNFVQVGAVVYFTGNVFAPGGAQMYQLRTLAAATAAGALAATGSNPVPLAGAGLALLLLGAAGIAASRRARRAA